MMVNIGQLYRVHCQHFLENLDNELIYTISDDNVNMSIYFM